MGLQFSWIEANLLGFFLMDVRNSRGKFDEIKEKFVINPAPIASQLSLNAGGTRWTRDLHRNSLNFFTSRSKVEEQKRGKYMLLTRELGPKSWPIEAIVGVVWGRRGSGSLGRGCRFNSARRLTSISLQHEPRSWHDRATIRPRSGHDWASIVVLDLGRPPSSQVRMIPRRKEVPIVTRSSSDRAAIGSRSGYDRSSSSCSVCRPMKIWTWSISAKSVHHPMRLDRTAHGTLLARDHVHLMKIPRSRSIHVRRHFANNRSRLMHLKPFNSMTIGKSSSCHVDRQKPRCI